MNTIIVFKDGSHRQVVDDPDFVFSSFSSSGWVATRMVDQDKTRIWVPATAVKFISPAPQG